MCVAWSRLGREQAAQQQIGKGAESRVSEQAGRTEQGLHLHVPICGILAQFKEN